LLQSRDEPLDKLVLLQSRDAESLCLCGSDCDSRVRKFRTPTPALKNLDSDSRPKTRL